MIQPTINWNEARRYAGMKESDPQMDALLYDCGAELLQTAAPKAVWKRMKVGLQRDGIVLENLSFLSADLRRHLEGCDEAVLMWATLGVETDRLIRRAGLRDMSRALMLQACAASFLEECCDQWGEEIAAETGLFPKPRFSPGYGDFSIQSQRDILSKLEAAKRIGLTVTEGMMLVPAKSVTAVIGLSKQIGGKGGGCSPAGCEACGNKNCLFRRSKQQGA
jgi:hypothetical protein